HPHRMYSCPRRLRPTLGRRPPLHSSFSLTLQRPPRPTLFPYTTLFRSRASARSGGRPRTRACASGCAFHRCCRRSRFPECRRRRSEEHTSELQSPYDLVCRLLLEKKKNVRNVILYGGGEWEVDAVTG